MRKPDALAANARRNAAGGPRRAWRWRGARAAAMEATHGAQPNDPARGAAAILAAVAQDEPPLHLPLGPEAFEWIASSFRSRLAALDEVRALGVDTAYAELGAP